MDSNAYSRFDSLRVFHNPQSLSRGEPYGYPSKKIINRKNYKLAIDEISNWSGYQVTPLYNLEGLAKKNRIASLYYKDESHRFGLESFKALGGAYATQRLLIAQLKEKTNVKKPKISDLIGGRYKDITNNITVACATDGNHGRSVAWGARLFGCNCIIYIHSDVSEGRKKAIENFGASVYRIDGDYDNSVRKIAADAEKKGWFIISDTSYEGYLEVPRDVMQGYTIMVEEALNQIPKEEVLTHVFIQGGVGGLAGAVCGHLWETLGENRPRFVVVEPERADCLYESALNKKPMSASGDVETIMAGLACGKVSLLAWEILSTGANDFVTIPDSLIAPAMRLLSERTGGDKPIVAGESAVAGLAVVLASRRNMQLARSLGLNSESKVLIFGTEGATDPKIYKELVGRNADEVRCS